MSAPDKIPTPIVDKNGKATTVHKSPEKTASSRGAARAASVAVAPHITKALSNREPLTDDVVKKAFVDGLVENESDYEVLAAQFDAWAESRVRSTIAQAMVVAAQQRSQLDLESPHADEQASHNLAVSDVLVALRDGFGVTDDEILEATGGEPLLARSTPAGLGSI